MNKQEMNDSVATIESLRQMMRDFVAERQWQKYHTPRNLAASISIEAAELLEHYQWLTEQEAAVLDACERHALLAKMTARPFYLKVVQGAVRRCGVN